MNWIDVGELEEIPRLGTRVVRTSRGDLAVFRTSDDRVFALRDACPHRGGPLSQGIVHGNRVTCPLHNWVISLDSGEATGPDTGCTDTYPVRIEAGRVFLGLAATAQPAPRCAAGA
ncbi:nitrite reductase (NAD(P)H) small subunit [Thioalkalivibrio denitrificans]|uniref:Nitrite reductase (NAD(P)H) small subunit n=1 Tax=Thioalkalivibrio denitrificans TaxID=108003 RepID=A0A1V3NNZ8_9GAMM|nr:nitrite reductase small subunit NirD [Thioalkalivibrio denitrificans]OOG26827.1 nitrite reductase (NAD(P)H) small subunit [Thioalkalivibrio denitrificans]